MDINATLLGQAITFALFVWFTMRYVWPPITQAMQTRKEKIADGLEAARKGKEEHAAAKSGAVEIIQEAKDKAYSIVEDAQQRATKNIEDSKKKAKLEFDRILDGAKDDIEKEAQMVRESLRTEVARIAVLGAEKILASSIDKKQHSEILNNLATEL